MNRAQRRSDKKQSKEVNKEYLVDLARKRAVTITVDMFTVAVAWVLHNKLHFGKKKILQTMKQIHEMFESIHDGYVSVDEIKEALKEEADIEFVKTKTSSLTN